MRTAIYLHVPESHGQALAAAWTEGMRAMAARDGWEIVQVYRDLVPFESEARPAYDEMLRDAQARKFEALLFWKLDNLLPHNANKTLEILERFSAWGIGFCSYQEPHLNTCHVLKDAVKAIVATLAGQNPMYKELRTRLGLARQRRTRQPGPRGQLGPGRPPKAFDTEKAKRLRREKFSLEHIAAQCQVSKTTIFRYFRALGEEEV